MKEVLYLPLMKQIYMSLKKVNTLNQVMDLLDNEKASFYSGSSQEMDNIPKEDIRKMKTDDVRQLVRTGLIVRISRH